jgi:hypothetical protein
VTPNLDSTQLIPRQVWENPRVHLLDDIWLLTIVAILIATAGPWLVGGVELDIATAGWGLLALGGIHVAFTSLPPSTPSARWHDRALTLLDVVGVMAIGFIWQHVGALQNPMFLTVFALPVIGSIFLSRWHPYLIAAVSVLVVGLVTLSQAPELRWYASGLLGSDAWLNWLFGQQSTMPAPSFSGFYAPSSYLLVLLEVFTIGLFACAVAAEYVGLIFERLDAHTVMARREAERGQELWMSLIEQLPLPALLIDPATLQVVSCSESSIAYLRGSEMPLEGRGVFEALRFSYPDTIQELIAGADGVAPQSVIHVADQLRVTQVGVLHVAHKGRRLALLTIEDMTELFCVKATLDTSEYAALAVDARGRLLTFNKHAAGLFGRMEVGADARQLLPHLEGSPGWWEPGLTGRRKMHIEIGLRIYQVTSSAIALAGEEESIFTVSLLPVGKAGAPDLSATGSIAVTTTMEQLR